MSEIPEDVMKAAHAAFEEMLGADIEEEPLIIARAIMAERERCIQLCDAERERRLASSYPAVRIVDFAVVAAGIARQIRSGELPKKTEG